MFSREVASEARLNSELELQKTGHRPTIRPYTCGQCLCCGDSCGCNEVDNFAFLKKKKKYFHDNKFMIEIIFVSVFYLYIVCFLYVHVICTIFIHIFIFSARHTFTL